MQYLFISDAHGDIKILEKIFKAFNVRSTQIFYNGDSELAANDPVFLNVLTVKGNMDFDSQYAKKNIYVGTEVTIFQTHGHLYDVNWTLAELIKTAKKNNAQIVTFGHTHQLGVEKIEDLLVINPGSISQPRGTYAKYGGTFALLTVTPESYIVEYFDRDLTLLNELTTKFSR
ncbi:metallophosphoesterase [Periweissella beninensis]|uniref:metallophosphoesterase n=1 Tax=Periweissella beninensis TaxID=504936 RepID=UPI0021A2AE85|nr:metallophosphoesterase [Periweissella beninensis]MCT4396231.1 metallophosphoesterase [Periweissella beninensis]